MGNLALTFPDLSAASFRPWIDESAARDAGQTPDEYAQKTAELWQSGLERSGIGPDRIKALRDAAEVTLYTPGSEAGVPLNVIGSLKAPKLSWETDEETIRDEIEGTVSSLLGLVGIEADPIGSREHVLLSNLLEHNWRAGTDLDLGALIGQIQKPPLRKLGVFEVDAFMPPADRNELAIKLNALVASPSFAAWGRGPALDPAVLLRTEDGKAARRGHLPRPPLRSGAAARRHARALAPDHLDARAVRDERAARARLSRRGDGLRAADGDATVEEADPDADEAGSRVRDRDGDRDAEPGRPRLQGDGERRQLVHRAPSDRAGQGARARGAALGRGRRRRRSARHCDRRPRAAPVPAPEHPPRQARALLDALGDVVPARPADEGADRDAHARVGATGRGRQRRARPRAPSPTTRAAVAPPVADGIPVRWLDPAAPWAAEIGADPVRQAPAGLPRRPRQPPLRRHEGRPRHDPGVGGRLRPARRRPRSRPRDGRRLRRPRSARRAAGRRRLRAPRRPARQGDLLPRRRPRDPAAPDRHADARAAPQRRARPLLAPGRDGGAVRGARRRGCESRRGRRDGEDPRPPGGEARPARARARDRPPTCRAGLRRAELASEHRVPLRPRQRRRRAPRRQGGHAHDRARGPGARRGRQPARHEHPRLGAEGAAPRRRRSSPRPTSRSSSRRSSTRWPRSTRSGPRRPTPSRRCRSGSRPATSASSRRRSCGSRRPEARRSPRRSALHGLRQLPHAGRHGHGRLGPRRRHDPARRRPPRPARADRRTGARRRMLGRRGGGRTRPAGSAGTELRLERDPGLDDVDRYGRLLRYVHVGGRNLTLELVRIGAAAPYFYRGERGLYARRLVAAAREARSERRGLWGACPEPAFAPSVRSRPDRSRPAAASPTPRRPPSRPQRQAPARSLGRRSRPPRGRRSAGTPSRRPR